MGTTLLQPGVEAERLSLLDEDPSVKGQQIWGYQTESP